MRFRRVLVLVQHSSERHAYVCVLVVLDVDLPIIEGLDGSYTGLSMVGQGSGPGDTYHKRNAIIEKGIKVKCEIMNKEFNIATSHKETVCYIKVNQTK